MKEEEIKKTLDAIDNRTIDEKEIQKALKKLMLLLKKGLIPKDHTYALIVYFGRYRFYDAERILVKYTKSPDEWYRYGALTSLVLDMGIRKYRKICEDYLKNDPIEENRMVGASCLGHTLRKTKDKTALKLLISILKNKKEHLIVRYSCYDSIMSIMGFSSREIVLKGLGASSEENINWNYIKSIEQTILSKK